MLHLQLLDGNGGFVGKERSFNGTLSDCQPIVYNNKIIYYVTENTFPVFFKFNTDNSPEAGDFNDDGYFNDSDVKILKEYLSGITNGISVSQTNLNGDENVDNWDLSQLRKIS